MSRDDVEQVGVPGERQTAVVAGAGLVLIAIAIASDFVIGSFWEHHALLTSFLTSLLVVLMSFAVINERIERRSRRRWLLLAKVCFSRWCSLRA